MPHLEPKFHSFAKSTNSYMWLVLVTSLMMKSTIIVLPLVWMLFRSIPKSLCFQLLLTFPWNHPIGPYSRTADLFYLVTGTHSERVIIYSAWRGIETASSDISGPTSKSTHVSGSRSPTGRTSTSDLTLREAIEAVFIK